MLDKKELNRTIIKGDNVFYTDSPQFMIERTNTIFEVRTRAFNSIENIQNFIDEQSYSAFFISNLYEVENGQYWLRYDSCLRINMTEEDIKQLQEVWYVRQ